MSLKSELDKILKQFEEDTTEAYTHKDVGIDYDMLYKVYEQATQAILDLLDKSLPPKAGFHILDQTDIEKGWNSCLEAVRKVIKEEL